MNETGAAPPNAERGLLLEAAGFWAPYVLNSRHPHLPFSPIHFSTFVPSTSSKSFLHFNAGKIIGNPTDRLFRMWSQHLLGSVVRALGGSDSLVADVWASLQPVFQCHAQWARRVAFWI